MWMCIQNALEFQTHQADQGGALSVPSPGCGGMAYRHVRERSRSWPRHVPVLPTVRTILWEGWHEERLLEEDVWGEQRALQRRGWTWTRRMLWLGSLAEERARRRHWWEAVKVYFIMLGVMIGGQNTAQERVLDAMLDEERYRRLWWQAWMRRTQGFGEDWGAWWRRWRKTWRVLLHRLYNVHTIFDDDSSGSSCESSDP